MAIALRKPKEIDALRAANQLVARAHALLAPMVKPGVTTRELEREAERFITSEGGRCSFKGLYHPPFPGAICTSVNEVIIHGTPNDTPLKEGDNVGIDIGVELDGWYGDAAVTLPVGGVSDEERCLIEASSATLYSVIEAIRPGMRIKEISRMLEEAITAAGFTPLLGYCGHGIGRSPHEEPSILNYVEGHPNQGPKVKEGMVFCLEPMLCRESGESRVLEDQWSVVSVDGLRGSHYEHTVAIIGSRAEILSLE